MNEMNRKLLEAARLAEGRKAPAGNDSAVCSMHGAGFRTKQRKAHPNVLHAVRSRETATLRALVAALLRECRVAIQKLADD